MKPTRRRIWIALALLALPPGASRLFAQAIPIDLEVGYRFVHVSGNDRRKLYPTAFGSGVAILDYDGDGRMDLYFATCTAMPPGSAQAGPNRLYRNLGGGKFRDVTESSGLGFRGFCHGIIAGDVDNDGDPDVFLCNYGPNALYINNGDGTYATP